MNSKVSLTLICAFLVLFLAIGFLFFIQPKRQELIRLRWQVDDLNTRIKKLTGRLVDIRRRADVVQVRLAKAQDKLSRQVDLLPILEDISELAKDIIDQGAGLGLEFVSVLPLHENMFMDRLVVSSVNGRKLYELPVQVLVRGRYRQLAKYLEDLRDLPYYSHINEVELKRKERPGSPGLLEMTVHLRIFYL